MNTDIVVKGFDAAFHGSAPAWPGITPDVRREMDAIRDELRIKLLLSPDKPKEVIDQVFAAHFRPSAPWPGMTAAVADAITKLRTDLGASLTPAPAPLASEPEFLAATHEEG